MTVNRASFDEIPIFELHIPDYITHVKLSEHRRAKYYMKGEPIPKKYEGEDFCFNKKGQVENFITGELVLKNPRVAGTPSWKKINGQEFYKGSGNPIMRAKMVGAMKDFFRPYFDDIAPILVFPITVELELHDNPLDEFDIDNLAWIYTKVILDVMSEKKIVPDDNVNFIAKSGGCQFVRTVEGEQRQLIIRVTKNNSLPFQSIEYGNKELPGR